MKSKNQQYMAAKSPKEAPTGTPKLPEALSQKGSPEEPRINEQKPPLERVKAWTVGLTGVLLVLPALVNSGFDVYSALAKVPKTESQKINDELFQRYFNKQPILALPIPVKRDAGTVEAKFSVFEGGDIYIEFGKRSQWFPFPLLEKTSLQAPFSIISTALAGGLPSQDGQGNFQQTDRLEGGTIIRERRWDNGILEVLKIDTRTGNILGQQTRTWPAPPVKQSGATGEQSAWLSAVDAEKLGAIRFRRFSDGYYVIVAPIIWRPSSAKSTLPSVTVPRGFVSSMESVPRLYWSILRPDGAFAYAGFIHDYLYWDQSTTRETADLVFKELLLELDVPLPQAELLFVTASNFGEAAWTNNANAKRRGERRVISRFPEDSSIAWETWKTRQDAFK